MDSEKKFISKYSGQQIDQVVRGVLDIRPKIHILHAPANRLLSYDVDEIEGSSFHIETDANGECTVLVIRYGNYTFSVDNITKEIYINEFKIYELDFSAI